jgi:hypothetical protein
MSDLLTALFGSKARVRVLRLFLLNADTSFGVAEIAEKTQLPSREIQKELRMLERIDFVKARRTKRRKIYALNEEFPLREDLLVLLTHATVSPEYAALKRIEKIGEVHLALISGAFLNYTKARTDMFIVVNNVSRKRLANWIRALEAEMGREICYVLMTLDEFRYRVNMTDRFLRDFLEGPYDVVVDQIPQFKRVVSGLRKR